MREIQLSQNKVALVDDWNYNWLNEFKWYAAKLNGIYYAVRNPTRKKMILMHRVIMNTPKEMEVDHIDHNGLNCLEENMRNCTHKQNSANKSVRGKSKYHGVSIYKLNNQIVSQIKINGKRIHLGTFKTEIDAACAYDEAAKKYFGEYANLNFK